MGDDVRLEPVEQAVEAEAGAVQIDGLGGAARAPELAQALTRGESVFAQDTGLAT